MDLIGWEVQELCQFSHQFNGAEFIQRNLLIKTWDVGSRGVSGERGLEGAPGTRRMRGHGEPHGGCEGGEERKKKACKPT